MTNDKAFKRLAISETGFVFDPATGFSYTVNSVGMDILNCFKNGLNEKDIIKYVVDNYEVTKEQAERDFETFLIRMQQYGIYDEEKSAKNNKSK